MHRLAPTISNRRMSAGDAYFYFVFLLALSWGAAPLLHATAIATGSISVTNLTITPASGTVTYGKSWTAQAFAQAQNSLCGCDSQFNSSVGGRAQADAMVMLAQGHALADAASLNQSASAVTNISAAGVMAANATGQPTIFNTSFSVTGGSGPVNVTFSAMVDLTQSLFTDAAGVSALSDASYALSLDGQNVLFIDSFNQIGSSSSWSNRFSGGLSDTITLNFNQTYALYSAADTDETSYDTPEPPTGSLMLLGVAAGFVRRFLMAVRTRSRRGSHGPRTWAQIIRGGFPPCHVHFVRCASFRYLLYSPPS